MSNKSKAEHEHEKPSQIGTTEPGQGRAEPSKME